MSNLILKKIIGVAIGIIVLQMLLPFLPNFFIEKKFPTFRRLYRISKKIKGYR